MRFLSECGGRKTGSWPVAKGKEVRKNPIVARTEQKLWEITHRATSFPIHLPGLWVWDGRTTAALVVSLRRMTATSKSIKWDTSECCFGSYLTKLWSISTVFLQLSNFMLQTSRLTWIVSGTRIGGWITLNPSGRRRCVGDRKLINLVPKVHQNQKNACSMKIYRAWALNIPCWYYSQHSSNNIL